MINLKVLSTAAAIALVLPMVSAEREFRRRIRGGDGGGGAGGGGGVRSRRWRRRCAAAAAAIGGGGGCHGTGGGGGFRRRSADAALHRRRWRFRRWRVPVAAASRRRLCAAARPALTAVASPVRRLAALAAGNWRRLWPSSPLSRRRLLAGRGRRGRDRHRATAITAARLLRRATTMTAITTTARSRGTCRPAVMTWRTAGRPTDPTIRPREPISAMTASGTPARNGSAIVVTELKGGAFRCAALFSFERITSAAPPRRRRA